MAILVQNFQMGITRSRAGCMIVERPRPFDGNLPYPCNGFEVLVPSLTGEKQWGFLPSR